LFAFLLGGFDTPFPSQPSMFSEAIYVPLIDDQNDLDGGLSFPSFSLHFSLDYQ
jgi:hypothetical protein